MRNRPTNWPLVIGVIGLAAAAAAVAVVPGAEPVRQRIKELPDVLASLPQRSEELVRAARQRYALAKEAFYTARAESERALLLQLREAKDRGSLPPV